MTSIAFAAFIRSWDTFGAGPVLFPTLVTSGSPASKCQVARRHVRNSELLGATLEAGAIDYASG